MGTHKVQRQALRRAMREAAVFGCLVHIDEDRPKDGKEHLRLIITNPKTKEWLVHSVGSSPKNADAMVNGVGNAVRRKARQLVGQGPSA